MWSSQKQAGGHGMQHRHGARQEFLCPALILPWMPAPRVWTAHSRLLMYDMPLLSPIRDPTTKLKPSYCVQFKPWKDVHESPLSGRYLPKSSCLGCVRVKITGESDNNHLEGGIAKMP